MQRVGHADEAAGEVDVVIEPQIDVFRGYSLGRWAHLAPPRLRGDHDSPASNALTFEELLRPAQEREDVVQALMLCGGIDLETGLKQACFKLFGAFLSLKT